MRTLLLLCAVGALFGGLSQAGSAGREFVLSFLTNHTPRSKAQLQLIITAVEDNAKVTVKASIINYVKVQTLRLGQKVTVTIPSGCELNSQQKNLCSVIVRASADVSITAYNHKTRTTDTALIYPTTELGREYYVLTPPKHQGKEFSITNYKKSNKVTVFVQSHVWYKGAMYRKGTKLTLNLKPYESVFFQSNDDLTGTRVTAQQPVAVFTGHACTTVLFKYCNHVYEQLLPVNKWGSTYIVPPFPEQSRYDVVYVTASRLTEIRVRSGKRKYSRSLSAGQTQFFKTSKGSPLSLQANNGIQVIMFFSGIKKYVNRDLVYYDAFMLSVLSTDKYCSHYSLGPLKDFDNEALIVAPTTAMSKLTLDNKPLPKSAWKHIPETPYVWTQIDANRGKILSSSSVPFALYSVGFANRNGYGSAGQCAQPGVPEIPTTIPTTKPPTQTTTCWAMGDPHYHSFDGRRFDFMGTCTYVIAKNCKPDNKLQQFEVLAENENRGNRRVSYVGVVTVKVYGFTITVVRTEKGRVRIDDSLWSLPVDLKNKKLRLLRSGCSVLIETDFGLSVRYDWNSRLFVSLTESLAGKTCGLCGNFNGNPKDDFMTPGGTQANTAVAFGGSWKVPGMGNNAKCRDGCVSGCGSCKHKNMERWSSNRFCGIITQKNGPFRKCHSTVDPQLYLENCKYDVCMGQGNQYFLCKALEDYAEVCQTSGIPVQAWRGRARCPFRCPAHSHYELCGSACPATCSDPNAPSKCRHPCVETCSCKKGFILSGNQCVRAKDCGCTHKGRYIPRGQSFWDDDSCRRWCKCKGNKKLKCVNKSCKNGQQCKVIKGIRKCHTVSKSTCHSRGDPHYMTFDKKKFDFQGTCVYQLAALCAADTELEHFEVLVQNDHRHNKRVSFTKLVEIKVYSLSIVITTSHKHKILVDNKLVNLPVTLEEGRITVQKNGGYGVVKTEFGLQVTFDWRSRASVTLPGTYKGAVCGLCGNYNGNERDDLIPKSGSRAVSAADFGNSWKVAEIPGCVGGCKGVCPQCDINQKVQYEQKNFCGIIKDPSGPFRHCHSNVDPAEFFEDCVFDVCLFKGREDVLCDAIASYTDACQNKGAKVYEWRKSQFCAMKCPVNSHYEICGNACPTSCMSLVAPIACVSKCKEGCSCDEDYVLSGDACVPMSKCGCLYDNNYYRSGQVFYPSGECQERCKCMQDGEVECKDFKCGPNEECKIAKGIQKCHPVGKGLCYASGDPHYKSFDGKKFDFQGTCTYTLSKSCGLKGTNLEEFTVNVENVQWNRNRRRMVSVTKLVSVEVYGFTIVMKHKMKGILVNGVLSALPVNLKDGAVTVYKRGNRYVVETDFELAVTYDLVYHATVSVPGNYKGKVCGLCGNFNGNKKDDFRNKGGAVVRNVNTFGASWKVQIPGVACNNGCTGKKCPDCKPKQKAWFSRSTYCGIMTARKGPFTSCHGKVDPKPFFDDCVFDVCASNGEGSVLCDSVAAYAFSCHKAGVDVNNWRTKSFCPMKCPRNTHYEVCADTWALTCPGLTDIVRPARECTEGCECNDGFSFNGEKCIEEKKCGCFDNGRSYEPKEVVFEENCGKKCTCKPDKGLVCKKHSCPKKTKCLVRKGVMGCYHTDPCEDVKCRLEEKCHVVKGEAMCVPLYTGTCWAWGDPHYRTFDGYSFDFQGTCKYVISQTCGDLDGLVPFAVTERNDNRGNKRVSYVRDVHVSVYGLVITISKNQVGRVAVDGQLLNLPIELDDGKVSVVQRGRGAEVQTDFGLLVYYDWNWHLVIKLPSSYHGRVCGLCGNFNRKRNDERLNPAGKPVSSVIEWGKSWQTADQDKNSPCSVCEKDCPSCDKSRLQRYQTQAFCGALTDKRGSFKQCHKKVDPKPFFHSCVFDICMNDGDKKMLCQALASYVSQCNDQGVKIKGWRRKYGCPMNCPRHSHYKECASPCQPSCPFPDQPEICPRTCVESCVCDKGFALSGGVCVPRATCGCSYGGRYYKPGQRFWADEKCGRRCECDTALGLVKCYKASCSAKEACTLVDGERTCAATSQATCSASGDPHYTTFDASKFDFQGTCVYQLVGLCSDREGLEPFNVTVQNDHRGSTSVSYTKTVKIYIYGISLTLSRQYRNKILLNDQLALLPLDYDDKLQVSLGSQTAVVSTAAGITVTFDWQSTARVTLPGTYQGAVCGLCGNYNEKKADDMTMSNGQTTKSGEALGKSWQVAETPGCSPACLGPRCKQCSDRLKSKYHAEKYCGVIAAKAGPFEKCHKQLDPAPFLKDCVFDACQYHGHFSAICDAIQTYASACQSQGVPVARWRRRNFCPMACPPNSHYALCASACPTTCASLTAVNVCHKACVEGCECDDGHLLSGDTCVPVKECGCSYEGRYYRKGDVFYPDSQCKEKCVCGDTGAVSCAKNKCQKWETCKLLNGVHGCHPVKQDKCVASGDPHYITFDNRRFDFQGKCSYVLAKACNLGRSSLIPFTVIQRNRRFGNGKVSVTKSITVQVFDYEITMEQGIAWKVVLDNEVVNLPLSLQSERLQVTQQGRNIIVQTDFGLKVLYNTVYYVEVIVPPAYQQKMCGLCGNNNNSPQDDFKFPGGGSTNNVDTFGLSWAVDKDPKSCGGCGKKCPQCPKAKANLYSKPNSCGIITNPNGPFQACHSKIDPKPYLSHCVFDVCAMGGDEDTQCDNVMAYALACQGAGVQIKPWRSESFCPASCPLNSHYELSARTCGRTCANFIRQFACSERGFEGCQCDDGFVFDANECVPLEDCGCVFNGKYLRVGESTICTKCKSKCTCQASGAMQCQKVSCVDGEECDVRDGVRGCFAKQKRCSVSNEGRLTSFDGMSGATATKGVFELTSLCDEGNEKWFRVAVDTRVCRKGGPLEAVTLYAFYKGTTVAVNSEHVAWVNGKKEPLPSKLSNKLSIKVKGKALVIDITPSVRVVFSESHEVTVIINGALADKVCGACGNANDDPKDDMQTANGRVTKNVADIVASWSAGDFSRCGL